MPKTKKQAEFVKWMGPVLDVLRDLGGSGAPQEVANAVAEKEKVPEATLNEYIKSGMSRFQNQVYWARQYLVWEGLIDSSKRGIWKLTAIGQNKKLSKEDSRNIFLKWVEIHAERRKGKLTSLRVPSSSLKTVP